MEEILNELITTLEEMNNEKINLSKIYKNYYTEDVKNRNLDDEMNDFLIDSIDLVIDGEVTIDTFEPNDIMKYMYNLNLEKIRDLENYALKLYRLYKKEGKEISYYEELENSKITEIKVLKEKELITVSEFEQLFNYSPSAQKGFRSQLNNPIPYIQKKFGSKIFYKVKEVEEWLNTKKRKF